MPHPQMFEDDDEILARVRAIALRLPEAKEKVAHGRPYFYTTKVFTSYGAWSKQEDAQHPQSVLLKLDESERQALLQRPGAFVPGYWGPSGWVGLDLDETTDWEEVTELITESYLQTAPARLARQLAESLRD
ncbi:MAG: MmcQ/YjbR family DNA-binding protein [Brooklawnia sp.]|uniref:MmcQ/YjbR family DNA-binding protein n=1 Tax=Brooklawnia sp. TaxID=2699740 RepID=UPI003C70C496